MIRARLAIHLVVVVFLALGCTDSGAGADIAIEPAHAVLATGAATTFVATVHGLNDTTVDWSASCGTVAGDGATTTYTAPERPGSCLLSATSRANPGLRATASIDVTPRDAPPADDDPAHDDPSADDPAAATYAVHPDGAIAAAQDEVTVDLSDVVIEAIPDPALRAPLPPGVTPIGTQAFRYWSPSGRVAPAEHPFVIALRVPEHTAGDDLAIGILGEPDRLSEREGDPAAPHGAAAWSFPPSAYDPASGFLIATVLAFDGLGFEARIVRSDAFRTATPSTNQDATARPRLVGSATARFLGACGPGFGEADVEETCAPEDAERAAELLGEAYHALTAQGFTARPRLMRDAAQIDVRITWGSPLRISVRVVPGPYRIELRPASTMIASGFYTASTGGIVIALPTAGLGRWEEQVVRHEYVHATQYGYDLTFASDDAWLAARWAIEGQAVVLQTDFARLTRASRPVRDMTYPLARSRWDGSAWGDAPSSEYDAQDFWLYLAGRLVGDDADAGFLLPFMEDGLDTAQIDRVLRERYPDEFGSAGHDGGLPSAYWGWVRNQVFEHGVFMATTLFGPPCEFTAASATPTVVSYSEGHPPSLAPTTLEPLSTHVYQLAFEPPAYGRYSAGVIVEAASPDTRAVLYRERPDAGLDRACLTAPEARAHTLDVTAPVTTYLVVSNTSTTSRRTHSLRFPQLLVDLPQDQVVYDEGPITFMAVTHGFPEAATISWTLQRSGDGSEVALGSTASGERLTQTVCDGPYRVRAEGRAGASGVRASRTIGITVRDLGLNDLVPGCEPSIRIQEPIAGETYPILRPVALRADVAVRGAATYPVAWRLGGPDGDVIATGSDASVVLSEIGPHTLHASFGAASDTVIIEAAMGEPPQASITAPPAGSHYLYLDHLEDPAGIAVTFTGTGTDGIGESLPPEALRWQRRAVLQEGAEDWTPVGSGSEVTIFLPYTRAIVQPYDVRLVVTDPVTLLTHVDTISVSVQRPVPVAIIGVGGAEVPWPGRHER